MVTILPKENDWSDTFQAIGSGFAQGYQNRSDEKALQKAIMDLGDNPSPRQILDAVTGAKTYNPASKQTALKNYLGNAEFEETKRHNIAIEEKATKTKQEAELKEQRKLLQDKKDAISLIENSELPDHEKRSLIGDVEAERESYRSIKAITKPKTGKEVNQPINPEQLKRIKEVRDSPEFKEAPSSKKYQMLTDAGVSRVNAESEVKIHAEEEKLSHEKKKEARAEELRFHQESAKLDETIEKEAKSAKNQIGAIEDTRKAINSGKIKPNSWTNIFRALGETGKKVADALLSKEEAVLEASIPAFLEGRKELFGVRLSDADLRLLQNKLPEISKSTEANRAILNLMEKYSERAILREKIARDIKKQNKDLRPLGYQDKINDRYEEMIKTVKIKNPVTGEISDIPAYRISDFINGGGVLVNE